MGNWRKLLARMASDESPSTYTYDEAAAVLRHLGFELAKHGGGSHRKWRRQAPDGSTIIIGLVESGSGPMKPYLIRDMIDALRRAGLLDEGNDVVEDDDEHEGGE